MVDREKVLHGLDSCGNDDGHPDRCGRTECPYRDNRAWCTHELAHDAEVLVSELLKAQKPRVMTWDELIATDHVYIETNKDGQKYIVPGIVAIVRDTAVIISVRIGTRLIDVTIDKDVYGIECRCWTSRPTEEQREATPWNAQK